MEQVFLEASGTYSAKIDLRTLPTPNLETVPFQSEYRQCNNMRNLPIEFVKGECILSELFGCNCFTNVHVVSFQTI